MSGVPGFESAVTNGIAEASLGILARAEAHVLTNAQVYAATVTVSCIAAY